MEVLSGYQFVALDAPAALRGEVLEQAQALGLKGTILLAEEGVNFSLTGPATALDAWLGWATGRLGLDAPVVNRQAVDSAPFKRLKVRVRREIVTFDPGVRPGRSEGGQAVPASEWNRLLERDDVQLIDTRNDYEYALGTFRGARNPGTRRFVEFKAFTQRALDPKRPVAMFCTGGIRCEKASAWLRSQGFDEVYQLQGGILSYLQATPSDRSRWQGECFVFDDRVSVDSRGRATGRRLCVGCRHPADGLDRNGRPPLADDGQCPLCGRHFAPHQIASMDERVRQVRLAEQRGRAHLGPEAQEEK
ncbi:MAG: rhodanese-related sulfurtransferase [Wenzhouxiangellaceae bacterium]